MKKIINICDIAGSAILLIIGFVLILQGKTLEAILIFVIFIAIRTLDKEG